MVRVVTALQLKIRRKMKIGPRRKLLYSFGQRVCTLFALIPTANPTISMELYPLFLRKLCHVMLKKILNMLLVLSITFISIQVSRFTSHVHYSVLKLFTGLARAACTHLKLTVNMAISKVITPASANTRQLRLVR